MRTTQRLAVYRDDPFDRLADPLHPLHKTRFKLLRVEKGKDPSKGIVGRNPIGQLEQLHKKGFFGFPECFDLHPSICSAQDSTNRQNDAIPQAMQPGPFHSRVFHLGKNAFQIS
jgi:hypothetical protein